MSACTITPEVCGTVGLTVLFQFKEHAIVAGSKMKGHAKTEKAISSCKAAPLSGVHHHI